MNRRNTRLVLLFCFSSVGCVDPSDPIIDSQSSDIYVKSSSVWQTTSVPVCWDNPDEANRTERGWVRDAIAGSWERVSGITFTGWGTCAANAGGIRIRIADEWPSVSHLGSELDGLEGGMILNFTFQSWEPDFCGSQREYCIRVIAVHEFGHALGFAHEQNKPDTPDWCKDQAQGEDGDLAIGPWDLDSVMNYCNPSWSGDGDLSAIDIHGAATVYGKSPWRVVDGLYAEGDNTGPWGLMNLGSNGVVQWRTDNVGALPQQVLAGRPWVMQGGELTAGFWSYFNKSDQLYAEGDNTGPWGLLSAGVTGLVQWRTDNAEQTLVFRPRLIQNGQFTDEGKWTALNKPGDLYAEGDNDGPWGLVSIGSAGVVQWRTDDNGIKLMARPWFLANGQFSSAGKWTQLNENGLYAEGDNNGPWGLVGLESTGLVQWRTDDAGSKLMARLRLLTNGEFSDAGEWADLNQGNLYAQGDNKGPWGLLGTGAAGIVRWRTDNIGQTGEALLMYSLHARQGNSLLSAGPWGEAVLWKTHIEDVHDHSYVLEPWGVVGLGSEHLVLWRVYKDQLMFRTYEVPQ